MMSKHAVLAMTECLKLEMDLARHDIRVSAVLPGVVGSNIFRSAGAVEVGDLAAAELERESMLAIAARGMTPVAAAATLFRQAADGEFYLLTQPGLVGDAMDARAEQLRSRRAPRLWRGETTIHPE